MGRTRELYELSRVRVLLFLREPEALFWVFVFPLILSGVLGFAFQSQGVDPVRVGLLEVPGSAQLSAALERDAEIELVRFSSAEEARHKLARAAIDLLLSPGDAGRPELAFDPARPEAGNARVRVLRALELARSGAQEAEVELRPVDESGTRYIDFLFPGLLGMNLMGTGMWGIGFALADVRRRKFLKLLLVTPMRRSSFFLSFMNARLVFLVLEMSVLTAFGVWVLGVPLRGSLLAFALVALLGAAAFAGIGVLTASRARTLEGVSGLMNLVMVPMWLGSGIFFSYERFPEWLHPFLRLLPLTALNDALRAVALDGEGLLGLLRPLALLLGWTVLSFAVALRVFRWQ